MTPLRVGCVGTGFIAGRHLEALAGMPEVRITAVADAVPDRASAVAAAYGARAYDDGLALLATEELDAVWLCVPPFAHGPLEAAAIDRALPFFVEKPIALDLDAATTVADGVRRTGLATAVGYHWRHLTVVEEAAAILRGRPPQLVMGYWLDGTPPVPWWSQRRQSGGQLVEQTTHIFDLVRYLVGEVATVTAVETTLARSDFATADVPTASSVTLAFESGAIGTISSTCLLTARHRVGLHLMGEGVALELSESSLTDHELRVVTGQGRANTRSEESPIEREDRDFVEVLLGRRRTARVPYDEAWRTQALVEAADRSAAAGKTVSVGLETARG